MAESLLGTMFGEGGWVFAQGAVGDTVVMAAGQREDLLRDVVRTAKAGSGSLPAAVRDALTEDTGLLLYVDMRKFLSGVAEIMEKIMEGKDLSVAGEPAVDLWMRASADGRVRRFVTHFDMEGFSKLIKEMREK
jgi:hypothetical protein